MQEKRFLTPELREKLKHPLDLLIRGSYSETMKRLKKLVDTERPLRIISVGDIVSRNMMKHGILPHVVIIDDKVMRKPATLAPIEIGRTFHVKNPAGTLSNEAWLVAKKAIEKEQGLTKIMVDGEEDLLALVAVLCAPNNSFVIYGQPQEGIVVVSVSEKNKKKAQRIVDAMESTLEKLK